MTTDWRNAHGLSIVLAQVNPCVGDIEGNVALLAACVKSVVSTGRDVDVMVFPELVLTGYPPEDWLLRPMFLQRVERALQQLAKVSPQVTVLVGAPAPHQEVQGRCYNSVYCLADGRVQRVYDKRVLPNYGVFDEQRYFDPGQRTAVMTLRGYRLGLCVCEDLWHAGPAEEAVAAGADILISLNASPYHRGKIQERMQMLTARALSLARPICYVNLYGGQDEVVFDGASSVISAQGQCLHRAAMFAEDQLWLHLTASGVQVSNCGVLASIENECEQIYCALVTAIKDYVGKNGFNRVVLGLSGGIDSALTLALAVDALGADKVHAVMMPSPYTSAMSVQDAEALASNFSVTYSTVSIEAMLTTASAQLMPVFNGPPAAVTAENLQARLRGVLLMALSNQSGALLLATGNKSEYAVGYATLYGDMAGAFAPLKDVSKTWVYALSRWRNREQEVIPARVLERPPSAELAPDQKDEDSLPAYAVLDQILALYIEEGFDLEEIVERGFDRAVVCDVLRRVNANEYKRRQAAPGVKVTRCAFGRERRYPITQRGIVPAS